MKPEIADVRRTLEYGQSHDLARKMLLLAFGGILVGLFIITPFEGSSSRPGSNFIGGLVIAASLAFLGVIIYRRTQPSVPSIVISQDGVLFRGISEKTIPWNEIRGIGVARVSASRDFFSTKVTKLIVSQRYYQSLNAGWRESVIAWDGDPSEIYLSYYDNLPLAEFQEAILRRWHAFSRHAQGLPLPAFADVQSTAETASHTRAPHSATVSRRGQSGQSLRAVVSLIRASSPVQLVVMAALLAGIGALLTNHFGLWSTAAQDRGRLKAAEWRAWQQKQDAERREMDENLRRNREMWDRAFKCMDEMWSRHTDCTRKTK